LVCAIVTSDQTLPRAVCSLYLGGTLLSKLRTLAAHADQTSEPTNPLTSGQRMARRHLRPCAGNAEEEAKQDDRGNRAHRHSPSAQHPDQLRGPRHRRRCADVVSCIWLASLSHYSDYGNTTV
jgi:hypothetical protein